MTRTDHLLTILAEECTEVGQRVTKALRFGIDEIQPGQPMTNAERILYEFSDLLAVVGMLVDEGVLPKNGLTEMMDKKVEKIEKYLKYSAEVGRLE